MKNSIITISLFFLIGQCVNAESFISSANKDKPKNVRTTELQSISRISINKYTKGVKYSYFYEKEKNHALSLISTSAMLNIEGKKN